ncbi:SAC1 (YKL212W) [Zygosaccharomyces parabailii]|nr:SAC1 (YKL212W) [Zygosaccharomyces parabailii]CDH13243.1 probable Phosphoinositide phosphatase SAC1 [Zygosaccharomyces bailii ISA1307]
MTGPLLFAKTSEGLLFRSTTPSKRDAVIHLSNQEQALRVEGLEEFPLEGNITKIPALLGFISLKLNKYAVIASKVREAGRINGQLIYQVTEHLTIPAKENARIDSDESEYLKLLKMQLDKATLYFSYTYDLTNSFQRNASINTPSWRTADTRFFWNHYLTEELQELSTRDASIAEFIQPVIYGYVKVVDRILRATPISVGLVTRRSRFRAGTRYFRRGIDEQGNVGNFNETEQLLVVQTNTNAVTHLFSFLQTRGSVPVYWAEINNLRYKPKLVVNEGSSLDAAAKHFAEQIKIYGDNYLVNLVNQTGHELPVKEAYESTVSALNDPHLHYVYFDFHHECRGMKWYRVKMLIEQLSSMGLKNSDFFHAIISQEGQVKKIINEQKSVVRTNCMDCLDRTNVVQSVLAHWVLQKELETAGVIPDDDAWENNISLLRSFQNLWADNADVVSCAYSGTGALKTDFTRTGKRTKLGAFNDFINSAARYYKNNLMDGPRQDSYDLFLGNFRPYMSSLKSPFSDKRPWSVQVIPIIFYAALTVLGATIVFPKGKFTSSKNLAFFFSASVIMFFAAAHLASDGIQYVNWPKLVDVGFLVTQQTHDKDKKFTGVTYVQNPRFVRPGASKKD